MTGVAADSLTPLDLINRHQVQPYIYPSKTLSVVDVYEQYHYVCKS